MLTFPHKNRSSIALWAVTPAAISCALWVAVGPITGDEHAARFRAWLASDSIVPIWNMRWMSGHHLPGYGIVMPLLARPVGVRAVAVAAVLLTASCVARFGAIGPRPRLTASLLSAGITANMWSGRLTFVTGVAFGTLACMCAFGKRSSRRGRVIATVVLCAVTTLTSPLVGMFLAMYAASVVVRDVIFYRSINRATPPIMIGFLATPAMVVGLTSVLFPEGGSLPFATTAWAGIVLACAAAAYLGWRARNWLAVVSCGVTLLAATVLRIVASPIGANVGRAAVLLAPAAIAALWPVAKQVDRRRPSAVLMTIAVVAALGWQWSWPVSDVTKASADKSNSAGYFQPLIDAIDNNGPIRGGGRIEVVPLRSKADADLVARQFVIARGWDRQLDLRDNALLYKRSISAEDFHTWLHDHAVAYVALPAAALDEGGRAEATLLADPPAYLREIPAGADWKLFAVADAVPIVSGISTEATVGIDSITFTVPAGVFEVTVRINDSRWLHVANGDACISRRSDRSIDLRIGGAGQVTLRVRVGRNDDC